MHSLSAVRCVKSGVTVTLRPSWSVASPTNQFNTRISSLEVELTSAEKQLTERCRADIPRRQTDLERLVIEHKDWENRLEVSQTPQTVTNRLPQTSRAGRRTLSGWSSSTKTGRTDWR